MIWDLWQDDTHSPYMNMAYDEALMIDASERQRPLLRLYEWDRDSISFGYIQKVDKVPQDKGQFVRRPTGGGIVFHKHHFTYTVVVPNEHWLVADLKPIDSYNWVNRAVQRALEKVAMSTDLASQEISKSVDRAGMVCFTTPTKYDILLDQRKVSGSAQRRAKEAMLHQGSIEMEGLSHLSAEKLRQVLPQGFQEIFECEFADFTPPAKLHSDAEQISSDKYSTDAWNLKR